MLLAIVMLAAVISTVVWYTSEKARTLKVGMLCYLYWGASLMWLVDSIYEYIELRAEFFTPATADMINDAFLGFSVLVLGLVIWTVYFLIKDPMGVIKNIDNEKAKKAVSKKASANE
ncbi:hypothetical protein [Eubacterium xylanophilum]|uniref:hypothetical protein n=1 Tax=Eubacterium xylanophilum TaxID=39497 RepID=UPI00047C9478|nr:hypothetical protein [Eubacterium xylanophilum]